MKIYRRTAAVLIVIIATIFMNSGCNNNSNNWIDTGVTQEEVNTLQKQVDEGHRVGLLDWEQVTLEFLHNLDLEIDQDIEREIVSDDDTEIIVQYTLIDGHDIQLKLIQPVTIGQHGIFIVKEYCILE